jgi:hypothetical protein
MTNEKCKTVNGKWKKCFPSEFFYPRFKAKNQG